MENTESYPQAILGVNYLVPTNQSLDWAYIDYLVQAIKSGEIDPEKEPLLFVGVKHGEGYFINDGNHHYYAYEITGVKAALSEVYPLE